MRGPAYPPARAVAAQLEDHLASCLAAAREQGKEALAPGPDARSIEEIVNAAFWASLRREEGVQPKISLAYLPMELAGTPLRFESSLPLDAAVLARLAPAVERPGIHLGVWHEGEELRLWGATRHLPSHCFVLEVVEPGLLVAKRRRAEAGSKFANLAVLQGELVKLVDEEAGSLPDSPTILAPLLGIDGSAHWTDRGNVLVRLAASMRAHGRGGSLLVVPSGSDRWKESVLHPVRYQVSPPFAELRELVEHAPDAESRLVWQESLRRAVEAVAGVTAVDGATVISDRYELLAFGAKIAPRAGGDPLRQVVLTEPVVGVRPTVADPARLGGTRHLSAAQFARDQRDAFALVASQDGRFTLFAWSEAEGMVRAHRLESLLL